MNVQKLNKLLKVRGVLQSISNQSFNFSTINKQHPIVEITDELEADEIIESYNEIISNITDIINKYYGVNP